MDLIGKLYLDYFVNNQNLDGKSHLVREFTEGGLLNIIKDNEFKQITLKDYKFEIFLILNRNHINLINEKYKDLNFLIINNPLPNALIFEILGERSSFVINDNKIILQDYEIKSNFACIFYGDKIYSETFRKYEKLYIDTAGNSYQDINFLSKQNYFPKGSIISISKEYLTLELLENFKKLNCYLIAHSPKETIIYSESKTTKISNLFYKSLNEISDKNKITGLGDKFILLVALNNCYKKLTLKDSIIEAQKCLSLLLTKK